MHNDSFDAVVFDLDGTLVDSLDDIADAMNAALTELTLPTHDRRSYQQFVGDGVRLLVKRALPEDRRDDATIEDGRRRMQRVYRQRLTAKTKPYPGIDDLLTQLQQRRRKLAVLSNKPHDFTQQVVGRLLDSTFDAVYGAREEIPRKPDATAAKAIAEELGVEPRRCLFVGDTAVDMKTATNAQMTGVGVLWGFRGAEELRQGGAAHLISEPSALLGLLGP